MLWSGSEFHVLHCSLTHVARRFRSAAMRLRPLVVPVLRPATANDLTAMGVRQCSCSMPGTWPPVHIWLLPQKVSLDFAGTLACSSLHLMQTV